MAFNSYAFVAFLLAVLAVYPLTPRGPARRWLLLLSSYGFYAMFSLPLLSLLLVSTSVDYWVARRMETASRPAQRGLLLCSLTVNLGMLGCFKYLDFVIENLVRAGELLGFSLALEPLGLEIPLGISFYTFQTLGYTIDVYRGQQPASRDPLAFATYVSFFPQLVAGPIERAAHLLPQCLSPPPLAPGQALAGLLLIAIGAFKKCVLADNLAPIVDRVFGNPSFALMADAWTALYAFGLQIYFDFSGYCDIAVGVALLLGFHLSDNFLSPYSARSFTEFWRRWHVTLSSWLRDYLYIPLGGSRGDLARTCRNLMLTMLLGGLWHGAGWTFVIWGALHGGALIAERLLGRGRDPGPRWRPLLVFHGVMVTWVFFRAASLPDALIVLRALVGKAGNALTQGQTPWVLGLTVAVVAFQCWTRERGLETRLAGWPDWAKGALAGGLLAAAFVFRGAGVQFIYFQF